MILRKSIFPTFFLKNFAPKKKPFWSDKPPPKVEIIQAALEVLQLDEKRKLIRSDSVKIKSAVTTVKRDALDESFLKEAKKGKITRFLEGIRMEHIDIKNCLESKLQFGYTCSIRIFARFKVIPII